MKLSAWILALCLKTVIAKHTCYSPDGNEVTEDTYVPCIAIDGVDSMCCKMNHTNPDICDPNGLCYSTKNIYWREYCTDPTWDSPNCLPKTTCADGTGGQSNRTAMMTRCPNGSGRSFCCGKSTDCCGNDNEIVLDSTLVSIGPSNSSESTTSDTQNGDGGSSSKVAIGVGVGVPLGILAISMLGFGFWWGKKKARAESKAMMEQFQNQMRDLGYGEPKQLSSKPIHEADEGVISPAELQNGDEENRARS
ncbi:hypothetical protein N7481_010188 [Penicillium waksmanii]|uniref:uncharacterized protein n=1 Tax=Penicillium waksmanii TaxID=69791 RepID=UPI002549621F|nr:uncharacterized protein N7481_010188 [Penicillium waksmanii]KAJ5976481.1 hypothetical protein N7481_010188 [Penicillium waksmanii]